MHSCIHLIAFHELNRKLMAQRIEQQRLLETSQPFQPQLDAILGDLEHSTDGIDTHAFVKRIQHRGDLPERCSESFQEGVFGFGEIAPALRTRIDPAGLSALDRIAAVAFEFRRVPGRTALF